MSDRLGSFAPRPGPVGVLIPHFYDQDRHLFAANVLSPHYVAARGSLGAKLASFACDDYPTDDQAIQAAIDALPAGGGEVLLSEGTFNIATGIVASAAKMTLKGAGRSTRLVGQAAIQIVTLTADEITVEDIAFIGNSTAMRGVVADQVDHAIIRHNYAEGMSHAGLKTMGGTLSEPGPPCKYARFLDNTLVDCCASIALDGENEDAIVAMNTILGSGAANGGINVDRLGAPGKNLGIVVANNRLNLTSHTTGAIHVAHTLGFAITGNSILFADTGAVQGIRVSVASQGTITGNQITGPDSGNEEGMRLEACYYSVASGNCVDLCGTGIFLDVNAHDLMIRDNNLKLCTVGIVPGTGVGHTIRDNDGYATENSDTSTGTGAQQTIAHGLATTPNRVYFSDIEQGANAYQSGAADATNIYVTAGSGLDYVWKAEVV